MSKDKEVVFFELNNWQRGKDYPNAEPFITWISDDFNICLRSNKWAKENKLCVAASHVDMSSNFCITATREWVEQNCPELLTKYREFLREGEEEDEDGVLWSGVYGRFGTEFLKYDEVNFGVKWVEEEGD